MIIFDLDGVLANCEHRKHFVDPKKNEGVIEWRNTSTGKSDFGYGYENGEFKYWKPDWQSFYEACDKDEPIIPVILQFYALVERYGIEHLHIWSGRCESVRDKTIQWVAKYLSDNLDLITYLKMRPVGDNTPLAQLQEKWLYEAIVADSEVQCIFSSGPASIAMWRRRGIFVFDCRQHDGEF